TLSSYPPTCDRLLENYSLPNFTVTTPLLRLKSLFVSNCCAGQYSAVLRFAEDRWQCRRSGRRTGANSPDGAERPECRANRLPCSRPAGPPAPAAPAAAERPPWGAGQRRAAAAPVGLSAHGRRRSPVRSGWAHGLWASALALWQPRPAERPVASA